jgi:phage terminase large subunit GpA-like protein
MSKNNPQQALRNLQVKHTALQQELHEALEELHHLKNAPVPSCQGGACHSQTELLEAKVRKLESKLRVSEHNFKVSVDNTSYWRNAYVTEKRVSVQNEERAENLLLIAVLEGFALLAAGVYAAFTHIEALRSVLL